MIVIIDYGTGNLRSVQKAFEAVGAKAVITADKDEISHASKLVLPGVGAVGPAMERLTDQGLVSVIRDQVVHGKPFLGICLGFQLLFDSSLEGGCIPAMGIISGKVERFEHSLKIPQMGWNQLHLIQKDCPMFKDIPDGAHVYFCHSYFARPQHSNVISATTTYGQEFTSAICENNVWGVQFHPEKSQAIGLTLLRNFVQC